MSGQTSLLSVFFLRDRVFRAQTCQHLPLLQSVTFAADLSLPVLSQAAAGLQASSEKTLLRSRCRRLAPVLSSVGFLTEGSFSVATIRYKSSIRRLLLDGRRS